jgi:molybdenum cofactor biosynthesis enzyme MoaA
MLDFHKPQPRFAPTGCKQCDSLALATNGRVRRCLVHDETIDPAWREQVRVRFEKLPELREELC